MKRVSLTEFKREFGALVDRVTKGKETLLVLERGVPVITVAAACKQSSGAVNAQLLRLERAGHLVRAGAEAAALDVDRLAVRPAKSVDALAALLDERRGGR